MNRLRFAALVTLLAVAAFVLASAFADTCAAPWGREVVLTWSHPRVAVVIAKAARELADDARA